MLRTVPIVIWSNYNADLPDTLGYLPMTDIMPRLMLYADIPTDAFYKKLLELNKEIPIRLSTGIYVDSDNNLDYYSKECRHYQLLNDYYCYEYNNLTS